MLDPTAAVLLDVSHVCQTFAKGSGEPGAPVLQDVSLILRTGEIVGLLGRSGCGKSTLLRIISGLARPTKGKVTIDGKPVDGPAEGVAMVFQSFALFPWLSVLDNVEIGLRAQGVPLDETRKRALAGDRRHRSRRLRIRLSQGAFGRHAPARRLRPRAGRAAAKFCLMDEPFSALDVLTAETLRTDLLDLWQEGRMPIKSILMVTHNIEEAVLMCDRVLVLPSNPGRVAAEIAIPLAAAARPPRPGISPDRRQDLRADDPAPRAEAGRPRNGRGAAPGSASRCRASPPTRSPACSRRSPPRPTTARPTCRIWPTRCSSRSTISSRSAKPATAASGRIRRRRHQAHAGRQALRRHGRRPAQETVRRPAARRHSARGAHQTRARRAAEPPRSRPPAFARSSRTTCRRTTPNARCARSSISAATANCSPTTRTRQTFSYENPQ